LKSQANTVDLKVLRNGQRLQHPHVKEFICWVKIALSGPIFQTLDQVQERIRSSLKEEIARGISGGLQLGSYSRCPVMTFPSGRISGASKSRSLPMASRN
jgi:hypothetical protein